MSHPTSQRSHELTSSPDLFELLSCALFLTAGDSLDVKVKSLLLRLLPVLQAHPEKNMTFVHQLCILLGAPGRGCLTHSLLPPAAGGFPLLGRLKALLLGSHSYPQTFIEHLLYATSCARNGIFSSLRKCRIYGQMQANEATMPVLHARQSQGRQPDMGPLFLLSEGGILEPHGVLVYFSFIMMHLPCGGQLGLREVPSCQQGHAAWEVSTGSFLALPASGASWSPLACGSITPISSFVFTWSSSLCVPMCLFFL